MEKIDTPLLILHSTADRLSDIKGSKQLYIKATSKDKTLKIYDGFYHELFNEPDKEKVSKDLILWLEAKRV